MEQLGKLWSARAPEVRILPPPHNNPDMNLKEKVVVITGGTKGLGRALAEIFRERGAQVIVGANLIKDVEDQGNILTVRADVTNEADVVRLAEEVIKKFGRIDVWVNNAGIWLAHAPIEEMDMKRVHDMIEVNLFGTMYGSKAALIQMRKQGSGTIVNILSTSAVQGRAYSSGYGASKFAAMGFTKSLRKEVEETNIKILAIYPGGMRTNLFDEQRPEDYGEYMDPKEVAEKIVANLEGDNPQEELIIKRA